MGGAAAEHTAFATMAHDGSPSTDENCNEKQDGKQQAKKQNTQPTEKATTADVRSSHQTTD
jgi:hypothetical protein